MSMYDDEVVGRRQSIKSEDYENALLLTIGEENIDKKNVQFNLVNWGERAFYQKLSEVTGISVTEINDRLPSIKNAKTAAFMALGRKTAYYKLEVIQALHPDVQFQSVQFKDVDCVRGFELMNKLGISAGKKDDAFWRGINHAVVARYNIPQRRSANKVGRTALVGAVAIEL